MSTKQRSRSDPDGGNVTIFTIGIAALTLAVVIATATAAAVHLERKRLWNFADSIALEVSERAAVEKRFGQRIDDDFVRAQSLDRLAGPTGQHQDFEALSLGSATGVPNENQIQVELRAVFQPSTVPWFLIPWSDGIGISAESITNLSP